MCSFVSIILFSEQVAEQLLIMHEECQRRNYSSIEKLRNSHVLGSAASQSRNVCTAAVLFY
jgi:pre-rRNA-processing protein TSR2